jgi:SAM-dependent methyltransferase
LHPSISKLFRERYDENWYLTARAEVVTAFIRHFCREERGRRIADLGAGTGGILVRLAPSALAVGVEEDEHLAKVGRQRHGLSFVRANLAQGIPIREESLDMALLLDVLEHVEDDRALLRNTRRLLRPGADLIVSVPALRLLWSRHDELHHHKRRYSKSELCAVLGAAGFDCARVTYYNSFLLPFIFLSRMLERLSGTWARSSNDYEKGPAIVGRVFGWIFSQERCIITRWCFPVGVSLIALAKNPLSSPQPFHVDRDEVSAALPS